MIHEIKNHEIRVLCAKGLLRHKEHKDFHLGLWCLCGEVYAASNAHWFRVIASSSTSPAGLMGISEGSW